MLCWAGGTGIDVYGGGLRRRSVSANIRRTGAMTTDATPRSPLGETPAHVAVWSRPGSVRPAVFAVKQLPLLAPDASARSAQPLPVTTFSATRFPRGRHGGPGSRRACGLNVTKRAVEKTAMP